MAAPSTATRPPASPPAPVAGDAAPAAERLGPVPTADEVPAASDHDAVVGHIGIEARRFDPGPMPLTLQPGVGCPAAGAGTADCEVTMGALAVRYWWTRNLALNAGVAFGAGGGRDGTDSRDTYFGVGPIVGLTLLLGNWRHLAVSASPELALRLVPARRHRRRPATPRCWRCGRRWRRRSTSASSACRRCRSACSRGWVFSIRARATRALWSVGVLGGDSIWGALSNLFVRYYL